MKRRHRIILKLCAFVAAGAIVNVAVAWGCAWTSPSKIEPLKAQEASQGIDPKSRFLGWQILQTDDFRSEITVSGWYGPAHGSVGVGSSQGLPELLVPSWAPELSPTNSVQQEGSIAVFVARADGWPFHALGGISGVAGRRNGPYVRGALATKPLVYNLSKIDPSFIPLLPLWPGFAINTVFYAAILWLLFCGPGFVRRRVRSMRGRCRACGYSLHNRAPDSTRCPECGATV